MSAWYYIATPISPDNFAGTKARLDIEALCERRGMRRIEFAGSNTANRRLSQRILLVRLGLKNWIALKKNVAPSSLVLFQYPHYPMKSAVLARFMMRWIRRRKQVRFVALVHDLNAARETFGKAAQYSDSRFLPQFDYIVCHNERMCRYLAERGFDPARLIPLGMFDYLAEGGMPVAANAPLASINIAGNLSREKSAYLYTLAALPMRFQLYLYGAGLDADLTSDSVFYEGLLPAETLPQALRGAFGLVWDGDSIDTCSGLYGAYLAVNNPHKLSLYLSAGIPVIVWSGSAPADFVERGGLGLSVSSLRSLSDALDAVSKERYAVLRQNARLEGEKIRAGYYFHQAMDRLEDLCLKR
ncbi:MAG: hypothetical protein GX417_13595 [Clostridiales bacterium]|nr:hypothetical protein [Clostridiales bacterium]